jgi:hypothetical protein
MSDGPRMRPLSDEALLAAWEEGAEASLADRVCALLHHALPEGQREAVDGWPVGTREGALLDAHAATFGERIDALAWCPACEEPLELELTAAALRAGRPPLDEERDLAFEACGHRVRFRPANAADLLAAAACADPDEARLVLVERCVLSASRSGAAMAAAALPAEVLEELSERMAAADPQADVRLAMACPACGHRWTAPFDCGDFLWREVEGRAGDLLGEVASLAAAYGWDERRILAMSPSRRRVYLELVGA